MGEWSARPLERVYAAVFIDAVHVKIRDGQVGNRPVYAAIWVDLAGRKDVLGLWAGHGGGETAKFWMSVLSDLKNRGVADVFFVVCDGLNGLPDSVEAVFPQAVVQTCKGLGLVVPGRWATRPVECGVDGLMTEGHRSAEDREARPAHPRRARTSLRLIPLQSCHTSCRSRTVGRGIGRALGTTLVV